MRVYHATKTKSGLEGIIATCTLLPGWNITALHERFVHLSLDPFYQGSYALDIIGEDTNEAWIVTLEIPEDTILLPDPSDEGQYYNGRWVVHEGPLAVQIIEVVHIPNVQRWESGSPNVPT